MKRSLRIAALLPILLSIGPVAAAQDALGSTRSTASRLILAALAGASVTLVYVMAIHRKIRRRRKRSS